MGEGRNNVRVRSFSVGLEDRTVVGSILHLDATVDLLNARYIYQQLS